MNVKAIPYIAIFFIVAFLVMCAGGCSSWAFTKETIRMDCDALDKTVAEIKAQPKHWNPEVEAAKQDCIVVYEKIVARQDQCLTAREMSDVEILIDNAALLTVGSSSMNSHEITLLADKLTPAILAAIEAWMGGEE